MLLPTVPLKTACRNICAPSLGMCSLLVPPTQGGWAAASLLHLQQPLPQAAGDNFYSTQVNHQSWNLRVELVANFILQALKQQMEPSRFRQGSYLRGALEQAGVTSRVDQDAVADILAKLSQTHGTGTLTAAARSLLHQSPNGKELLREPGGDTAMLRLRDETVELRRVLQALIKQELPTLHEAYNQQEKRVGVKSSASTPVSNPMPDPTPASVPTSQPSAARVEYLESLPPQRVSLEDAVRAVGGQNLSQMDSGTLHAVQQALSQGWLTSSELPRPREVALSAAREMVGGFSTRQPTTGEPPTADLSSPLPNQRAELNHPAGGEAPGATPQQGTRGPLTASMPHTLPNQRAELNHPVGSERPEMFSQQGTREPQATTVSHPLSNQREELNHPGVSENSGVFSQQGTRVTSTESTSHPRPNQGVELNHLAGLERAEFSQQATRPPPYNTCALSAVQWEGRAQPPCRVGEPWNIPPTGNKFAICPTRGPPSAWPLWGAEPPHRGAVPRLFATGDKGVVTGTCAPPSAQSGRRMEFSYRVAGPCLTATGGEETVRNTCDLPSARPECGAQPPCRRGRFRTAFPAGEREAPCHAGAAGRLSVRAPDASP